MGGEGEEGEGVRGWAGERRGRERGAAVATAAAAAGRAGPEGQRERPLLSSSGALWASIRARERRQLDRSCGLENPGASEGRWFGRRGRRAAGEEDELQQEGARLPLSPLSRLPSSSQAAIPANPSSATLGPDKANRERLGRRRGARVRQIGPRGRGGAAQPSVSGLSCSSPRPPLLLVDPLHEPSCVREPPKTGSAGRSGLESQ